MLITPTPTPTGPAYVAWATAAQAEAAWATAAGIAYAAEIADTKAFAAAQAAEALALDQPTEANEVLAGQAWEMAATAEAAWHTAKAAEQAAKAAFVAVALPPSNPK